MTTRILSFRPSLRALRLVVASLLVVGLITVLPGYLWLLPLVGWGLMCLAWFIVPGDRRWFIPASLLFGVAWLIWPTPEVRYQIGKQRLIVHRLTGTIDVYVPPLERVSAGDIWRHPAPIPRPSLFGARAPKDTSAGANAVRAAVAGTSLKPVYSRINVDTAWVRVVDRSAPSDVGSDGRTPSGTAFPTSEIRVERRQGRWTVSKPKP